MAPQITIEVTEDQLKALDDHNAAVNAKLKPGAPKSSRQTFAEAAVAGALEAAAKPSKKANPKD